MSEEFQPYRTSTQDHQDFEHLVELQRRYAETRNSKVEDISLDEDEDDDFSVHAKSTELQAPPIPDMRYEKQVEASIKSLREKGTSPIGIFWAIVVKEQIIVPFISGFVWCVGTHAWSWYRTKGVVNAKSPKRTFGFFRGLHHGITEWTK